MPSALPTGEADSAISAAQFTDGTRGEEHTVHYSRTSTITNALRDCSRTGSGSRRIRTSYSVLRFARSSRGSWPILNLMKFLMVGQTSKVSIPANTDAVADPKAAIIELARKSRSRAIQDRIAPRKEAQPSKGRITTASWVRLSGSVGLSRLPGEAHQASPEQSTASVCSTRIGLKYK